MLFKKGCFNILGKRQNSSYMNEKDNGKKIANMVSVVTLQVNMPAFYTGNTSSNLRYSNFDEFLVNVLGKAVEDDTST